MEFVIKGSFPLQPQAFLLTPTPLNRDLVDFYSRVVNKDADEPLSTTIVRRPTETSFQKKIHAKHNSPESKEYDELVKRQENQILRWKFLLFS